MTLYQLLDLAFNVAVVLLLLFLLIAAFDAFNTNEDQD